MKRYDEVESKYPTCKMQILNILLNTARNLKFIIYIKY